jgi:hypothetical protein
MSLVRRPRSSMNVSLSLYACRKAHGMSTVAMSQRLWVLIVAVIMMMSVATDGEAPSYSCIWVDAVLCCCQ